MVKAWLRPESLVFLANTWGGGIDSVLIEKYNEVIELPTLSAPFENNKKQVRTQQSSFIDNRKADS